MEVFVKNLKHLASVYSQQDIAQKTGFSSGSIANYINGKSLPSAQFLLQLKKSYKIDIDQFLTVEMDKNSFATNKDISFNKYFGTYIVYYYNSSAYKGKVGSYNYDVLTFGIISVVNDTDFSSPKGVKAYGLFMIDRTRAEEYYKTLKSFNGDIKKIAEFYAQFPNYYWGSLDQNPQQIFVSLKNNNDKCLIILNNPPTQNNYIGGLGTVNSISRGREHIPCVQYILFSSKILKVPDGEIYNLLALGLSDINIKNEVNELVTLFKRLYVNQKDNGLSEYQQKKIIEDSVKNIIANCIESNMFRFAKVSNFEDDNYYRLIKDADYD